MLELPPAGVLIGADRQQAPVALPAIGPRPTRLGVLGDHRIATLLAYRLLGVGCRLTVATADPARWRRLLAAAGARAMVGAERGDWPPPTAGRTEPQLLVTDLPTAPPPALGDRPLCTVVHVATAVPTGSPYWAGVDGVVLAGHGYGTPLARLLRPRPTPASWTSSAPASSACWTATARSSSRRSWPRPSWPCSPTDPQPERRLERPSRQPRGRAGGRRRRSRRRRPRASVDGRGPPVAGAGRAPGTAPHTPAAR